MKNRDLINNDEYDELFGCASFDEITSGINNILEDNQIKDIELKVKDNKNFQTVILKKKMLFPEIVD